MRCEHERLERGVGAGPFVGEAVGVYLFDREVLVPFFPKRLFVRWYETDILKDAQEREFLFEVYEQGRDQLWKR